MSKTLDELKAKRERYAEWLEQQDVALRKLRSTFLDDERIIEGIIADYKSEISDLDRAIAALSPAPSEGDALGEVDDRPMGKWTPFLEFMSRKGAIRWMGGPSVPEEEGPIEVLPRAGLSFRCVSKRSLEPTRWAWTEQSQSDSDIIAYWPIPIEPAAEAKGEGIDDGEAMRMAHSIMPGSGATFKTDEEIRESVRPHASDCARNNEPAYPAGKCDCTLRLKWTRYSEIAPKSPDELAGYEVQSHYSPEVGEWVYRHYPIAVAAGVDPLAITIASSSQHAEESARAQEAEADFWAKHLVKA
jgi:hypothetical protein